MEKNDTLKKKFLVMRSPITSTLPSDLKALAVSEGISFKHAFEFGVKFKLAEISNLDYPPNKLIERIQKLSEIIEIQATQILELEKSLKQNDNS